jgi:hypothetical protein
MERIESELKELRGKNNGSEGAFAMYSSEDEMCQDGLSKREYFAGLALQSVIANGGYSEIEIPICAVNFADALLFELAK